MTDIAAPDSQMVQPAYRILQVGDPVPWFKQNSTSNPQYSFDTAAGRYIVLCFYGTGSDETGRATLASFQDEHRALFDDDKIALFGVSVARYEYVVVDAASAAPATASAPTPATIPTSLPIGTS